MQDRSAVHERNNRSGSVISRRVGRREPRHRRPLAASFRVGGRTLGTTAFPGCSRPVVRTQRSTRICEKNPEPRWPDGSPLVQAGSSPMDPRFQQHVSQTGPSWPGPHDPAYGPGGGDPRRLSPHPHHAASMPAPDSRPGYPSLAPAGHPHSATPLATTPSGLHPDMQGLPSMPPPISEPDRLADGMAHLGFRSSPNGEASVGLPFSERDNFALRGPVSQAQLPDYHRRRTRTHLRPSCQPGENALHARTTIKGPARPHSPRPLGPTCRLVSPRTSRPRRLPTCHSRLPQVA